MRLSRTGPPRRAGPAQSAERSCAERASRGPADSRRWRSARCWWRNWPPCAESTLPACANVPGRRKSEAHREFRPSDALAALETGRGWVMLDTAAQVVMAPVDWRGKVLVSGAYHPLHVGHLALGHAAASFLGRAVVYELPLANADKAPLSLPEAQRRAAQFAARAPVVLSRAPLFAAKAALYPGARLRGRRRHRGTPRRHAFLRRRAAGDASGPGGDCRSRMQPAGGRPPHRRALPHPERHRVAHTGTAPGPVSCAAGGAVPV